MIDVEAVEIQIPDYASAVRKRSNFIYKTRASLNVRMRMRIDSGSDQNDTEAPIAEQADRKDGAKGAVTSAGVTGKEASESRVPWRHVRFNQYANMTDTNYTEAPRPL